MAAPLLRRMGHRHMADPRRCPASPRIRPATPRPPRCRCPTIRPSGGSATTRASSPALNVATAAEQRLLRSAERRALRAQRIAREPDFVALMPQLRDDSVTSWVKLENLDDDDAAPRFDFMQILAGKDAWKPILIAAQKQAKAAAGARAPMVAPAPGDPDGRYFVGSKPCETCHAGLFDDFQQTVMGRNIKSGKITPQGKMECETCHGPGSAHVNGGGGREKGGIRSFRLTDSRGVDIEDFNGVCLSCHERATSTYWQGSAHETRGAGLRRLPHRDAQDLAAQSAEDRAGDGHLLPVPQGAQGPAAAQLAHADAREQDHLRQLPQPARQPDRKAAARGDRSTTPATPATPTSAGRSCSNMRRCARTA